jgi:hypothetical protein
MGMGEPRPYYVTVEHRQETRFEWDTYVVWLQQKFLGSREENAVRDGHNKASN